MCYNGYPVRNDDSLARFNGGGINSITEKQMNYILILARQRKADLKNMVGQNYYDTIQHFTGAQANKLIRELKQLPRAKK